MGDFTVESSAVLDVSRSLEAKVVILASPKSRGLAQAWASDSNWANLPSFPG